MLQLLIAIIGMLATIIIVVGFHEFGHFIVARLVGVKVLRFSIGFGKSLFSWKGKKGTEYVIAAIPLGGYVKLLDENEAQVEQADLPFAYNQQPFYKKFAIVAAGPIFNLILAFVIYWGLFVHGFNSTIPLIGTITPHSIAAVAGMKANQEILQVDKTITKGWISIIIRLLAHTGDKDNILITTKDLTSQKIQTYILDTSSWAMNDLKPDPLSTLGITPFSPTIPAIIEKVAPNSSALNQLKSQDKILAVDNKKILTWFDLLDVIDAHPDSTLMFKIEREGKILQLPVTVGSQRDLYLKKHGFLGVSAHFHLPDNLLQKNEYSPITALFYAWRDTIDFTHLNFMVFGKLFTGKISLASLGGPITIFQSAGNALNNGLIPFFSFLAFLSISIGLVNTLPIPGLDGGLAFFLIIEFIIRRPIPFKVQALFYRLGLILLLLLISQALLNDILRL